MRKITKLWQNLSKLCLEYCGLFFFTGHGVYINWILTEGISQKEVMEEGKDTTGKGELEKV